MRRLLTLLLPLFFAAHSFAQVLYYQSTSNGTGSAPTIQLGAVGTLDSTEFVFRDRVPNGRHEQPSVEFWEGRTHLFTSFPWDTKHRGLGVFHFYDSANGFYPAAITSTQYGANADNHLTSTGITHSGKRKTYIFREQDHHQRVEIWKTDPDDLYGSIVVTDTIPPNNARETLYEYRDTIVMAYQLQTNKLALRYYNTDTDQIEALRVLIYPHQTGKRIYVTRPHGRYYDSDGWAYMGPQISTSGGHEEYAAWKTQDFTTFWNLAETNSYTFNASADSIPSSAMQTNGFKVAGTANSSTSLPNFTSCLGDDDVYRALFFNDANNTLNFIYHNGSAFVSEVITLPGGLVPRRERIDYTYTSINNNGGNIQIVIPGVDVSWDFLVGSDDFVDAVGSAATITASTFSGGNTLVTFNSAFSSSSSGTVRSVWPDGSCVLWMQHKGGSTYFTIMVQDGIYKKWHLFKKTGATITDLGDVFAGINQNIHKCSGPVNEIPYNVNFVFYGSKYVYLGDDKGAQYGTVYTRKAAFGPVASETPYRPSTTYSSIAVENDSIQWKARFTWNDVTESGGVISLLNDQSGNGRHAAAVGSACLLENGSIKTYGSSYFSLATYADFHNDSVFTLAFVGLKIGNNIIMSMGDNADANDHIQINLKSGGSVVHQVGLTSVDGDTITFRKAIKGVEKCIVIVTSDRRHLRTWVNGVELNKRFSPQAITNMVRWAKFYNTALDNVLIGAKINASAQFTPMDFNEWGYVDRVITYAQRATLENTWAAEYSIDLGTLGTIPTYEPETQRVIDSVGTMTSGEITDLNTFVLAAKTAFGAPTGEWSLGVYCDLLYNLSATNSTAATYNLARPKFDLTLVNAPAYTANYGYASNGTSSYADTGFNPSIHSRFTTSTTKAFGYVTGDVTRGNKSFMGLEAGTNLNVRFIARNTSDNTSSVMTATTALTIGSVTSMPEYYAHHRNGPGSSTQRVLTRGTTTNSGTTAVQSFVNANLFLLANNDDGTPAMYFDATLGIAGWCINTASDTALRTQFRTYLQNKGVSVP